MSCLLNLMSPYLLAYITNFPCSTYIYISLGQTLKDGTIIHPKYPTSFNKMSYKFSSQFYLPWVAAQEFFPLELPLPTNTARNHLPNSSFQS